MSSLIRTRWAAIGAAIAITLGAGGGFGFARAALSSGERAVFVPITPCRILDTRPAPHTVGGRNEPIETSEILPVNGRGTVGNCTLPNDVSALVLNVTAVGATQQTNLRILPMGAYLPTASSLNPTPGAPPTPNSVTTDLSAAGQFGVWNAAGTVNVIIDVNGYYVDHNHDDRYYTKAQADATNANQNEILEVIGSSSVGIPFISEGNIGVQTITTTAAGRLDVRMSGRIGAGCAADNTVNRDAFLLVDTTIIQTSAMSIGTSGALNSVTLTGITSAIVPAGVHTIRFGFACSGPAAIGYTQNSGPVSLTVAVIKP